MQRNIINKQDLERLYLKEQKTDLEIAKLYSCSKGTVYNTRKRFGILAFKRWQRHICEPTNRQLQIIYGSLLGDASISNGFKSGHDCESIFEEHHCSQQKEYLFWKYNELKNLCVSEPKEDDIGRWRLRTFSHPFFSNLRKIWYPNEVKIVPNMLFDFIDSLCVAVWFMDDGSLSKSSNFIKIHTCSFSESEHKNLIFMLENRFKIMSHMKIYSGYKNLVVDLDSRKNFVNLIKEHVVSSMKHKITFREYYKWVN